MNNKFSLSQSFRLRGMAKHAVGGESERENAGRLGTGWLLVPG